MYEELDLDYSINNLDEEYARKQTSFQELAYMHYA